MRIKLDENMPASLSDDLQALGHDVDTVLDEGLRGRGDEIVWESTQTAQRFLVTQDLDFSDLRRFAPGTHRGVMIVRLRHPSRDELRQRVLQIFEREDVSALSGGFVVVSDSKVRIRLHQSRT